MNLKPHSLMLAVFATIAMLFAPNAYADGLNILIMSEDAADGIVPRGDKIYNRVIAALSEEMTRRGFTVIDENIATRDIIAPNSRRRNEGDLIDIARAIRWPPIDAVIIFQIAYRAETLPRPLANMLRPVLRISGRVVGARSGTLLGTHEVWPPALPDFPSV
jgi:hypothetical protein